MIRFEGLRSPPRCLAPQLHKNRRRCAEKHVRFGCLVPNHRCLRSSPAERFTDDGIARPIQVRPRCDARSSFEPPINANGRELKTRSWASFTFMSVHSRFLPTRTAGDSRPVSRPYSLTANCALTPKRLSISVRASRCDPLVLPYDLAAAVRSTPSSNIAGEIEAGKDEG